MTGKIVSHYRVLEQLGEGGMGVVYKAEDTRLKRTVALKFLSSEITGRGEFKERFIREAQAAAALDHPNICTVYEIDEVDGQTFLSMAFLEGDALDRVISKGPIPIDRVISIAVQAGEGLAAAHEQDVVHRDVKSANMIVREDSAGRPVVTLMDFGLAQMTGRSKLTQTDTRLGTVSYMSPEQTQGGAVDQRSDLWSLGVVIYEMVTDDLPFKGHYDQAILYSIINEDPPPLTSLRSGVPMELEWIVEKCLAKSPGDRYQNGRELIVDLERLQRRIDSGKSVVQPVTAIRKTVVGVPQPPAEADFSQRLDFEDELALAAGSDGAEAIQRNSLRTVTRRLARRVKILTVACGLLAAALIGSWAFRAGRGGPESPSEPLRRFSMRPANVLEPGQSIGHLAISPNGRHIAFSSTGSRSVLWLQPLDRLEPRKVEGTEGARFVFWSPDSRSLGFTTDRSVKKFTLRGGSVTTLADIGDQFIPASASWSPDGKSILVSGGRGTPLEVPALGGTPKPLFEPTAGRRRGFVRSPRLLEDSRGQRLLLYSERTPDGEAVMLRRLSDNEGDDAVRLVEGSSPTYAGSGHILYQPSAATAALWALPVSLDELKAVGEAFPIAEDGSAPSVAEDGTLVYLDNPYSGPKQLIWIDRAGNAAGKIGKPQPWIMAPRVSPDGQRVVVSAGDARAFDLWVHESSRAVMSRISFEDGEEAGAIWSADGTHVAFRRRGSRDVFVQNVGGGTQPQVIFSGETDIEPLDWSRDGKTILFQMRGRSGERGAAGPSAGIGFLQQIDGEDRWEAKEYIAGGRFIADGATFSPNGRYVSYESNESGEFEVYVKRFPATGERWQISSGGGREPRWGRDGRELYFARAETLYSAQVVTGAEFAATETSELFSRARLASSRRFSSYDVGSDGRFAVVDLADGPPQPAIRVVLNWFSEFGPR